MATESQKREKNILILNNKVLINRFVIIYKVICWDICVMPLFKIYTAVVYFLLLKPGFSAISEKDWIVNI